MTSARISRSLIMGGGITPDMTGLSSKLPTGKTLAAVMGSTAAAAALTGTLLMWEGKENVGYLDIAKVPTKCSGDTDDVVVGKFYTDYECAVSLERQAVVHVEGVLKCTPGLRHQPNILHAAGSLTYNIGVGAYCRSTSARRFNAGDFRGGCQAMLNWKMATIGGRKVVVRGLENRRLYEYRICIKGLVG